MSYYAHSAYHQAKLIRSRQSIQNALAQTQLNDEQKRKLKLVLETKAFGENSLGLTPSNNYTSYIELEEPYVTYIVQAAETYQLKPYLWSFPFVGDVPYKGFFRRALAESEAAQFDRKKFDTYVRGVSAYSTLGWFEDSVLSSMLRYEDRDLVELILHESIHTTLYIKSAAEFNERLASFMGHEGMKLFYMNKEGPHSTNLKLAEDDSHDQRLFSEFLTKEIDLLKNWYESQKGKITSESKARRLRYIQERFSEDLRPHLKTQQYVDFEKRELNNALLLAYRTYEYGHEDFARVFDHFGRDFKKTLAYLKSLEKNPKPDQALKDFVSGVAKN